MKWWGKSHNKPLSKSHYTTTGGTAMCSPKIEIELKDVGVCDGKPCKNCIRAIEAFHRLIWELALQTGNNVKDGDRGKMIVDDGLPYISSSKEQVEYLLSICVVEDIPVFINHTTETGGEVYAVQIVGSSYWLNSFKTEFLALGFIADNNLRQVDT